MGKLIFLIGGAYVFIFAAAVIHSIGGLGGLRESVEENIDSGQNLVDLSSLYSKNAVLLDLDTGEIAAQKKSQERIYPASLTKMRWEYSLALNSAEVNKALIIKTAAIAPAIIPRYLFIFR